MKKQNAHAVKFQIGLNFGITQETVYLSDETMENLPSEPEWGCKNVEAIIPEYFTKEKIEELKHKFCEQIMNSENPFFICENDLDYYPVEEDKIWK